MPKNARRTPRISPLLGFLSPKKLSAVETIMVPPVTIGYWTDASTCTSASTSKKFATLLIAPLNTPIPYDCHLTFFSIFSLSARSAKAICFSLRERTSHAIVDRKMVAVALHMLYPAALAFGKVPVVKILDITPDMPFKTKMPT